MLSATCVRGSDLWDYRGINPVTQPTPLGHEYVGIVEETGSDVTTIKPGQFVVGSFFASDNTCEICQAGYQTNCIHSEVVGANGAQAQYLRVPLASTGSWLIRWPVCRPRSWTTWPLPVPPLTTRVASRPDNLEGGYPDRRGNRATQ